MLAIDFLACDLITMGAEERQSLINKSKSGESGTRKEGRKRKEKPGGGAVI